MQVLTFIKSLYIVGAITTSQYESLIKFFNDNSLVEKTNELLKDKNTTYLFIPLKNLISANTGINSPTVIKVIVAYLIL